MGKEFGDLMSSVSTRNRYGRILYRTKCDPFLMLSHALGTSKTQNEEQVSIAPPVEPVADYLSQKVHELVVHLMAECEQAPVDASTFYLEAFTGHVDPDLWEMVTRLSQSSNDRLGRKRSDSHIHERKLRNAYLICVDL